MELELEQQTVKGPPARISPRARSAWRSHNGGQYLSEGRAVDLRRSSFA